MKPGQRQKKLAVAKQKSRRQTILFFGVAAGLLLIITAVLWPSQNNNGGGAGFLSDSEMELVAMGEGVYNSYCAACHGFELEGQLDWKQPFADGSFKAPPHDETGHTWHHDDAYLVESIKLGGARLAPTIGVSAMPAYDEILTDQQISAVLAYIKSQWPAEILEAQSIR